MAKNHTDGDLYCERAIAQMAIGQTECSRSDAATAVYLYKGQEDPDIKPWEKPTFTPMSNEKKLALALKQSRAYKLRGQVGCVAALVSS